MKCYEELLYRGGIKEVTDDSVIEALDNQKLRFYLGIDPTADSMHVGHLFGLINCRRLQMYGHEPIILIGGCTGMIGDPSGKNSERKLLTAKDIDENVKGLEKQVKKLITPKKILNNYDWTHNVNVIDFLRDIGKNFSVNNMLTKESVKSRMESGISYTEFSYQIMQAWDFLHLYENEGVSMQVGGTEQWGNITAGLDLIKKYHGNDAKVYGMVWPLITKSDGTKFGKSASGAVWLDKEKTSPYEFYQFWLNQRDDDALKYVKKYTFLSHEEISEIERQMKVAPHERSAQKALGKELTILVHSKKDYEDALRITDALFNNKINELSAKELLDVFKNVPQNKSSDINIVEALIKTGLASSKRQAREFISGGAVRINGNRITDLEYTITKANAIEGIYTLIKRGKKLNALLKHE